MGTTACVADDGDGTSTTLGMDDAAAAAAAEATNPHQTTLVQSEQVILALQRLDDEYSHLSSKEQKIEQYLETLQQEESALRHALVLTSTSLKEQRISEKKRKEEEALARLEEALMMDHADGSSGEEDDT